MKHNRLFQKGRPKRNATIHSKLKKNGKIIIEIGENQKYTTMKLLQINGFYINNVCRDYQTKPRVLVATKSF